MKKLSNKEFCKRLRKARDIAVKFSNPDRRLFEHVIADSCWHAHLTFAMYSPIRNCIFFHPDYVYSCEWVNAKAETIEDIVKVFNDSILALGEKP
jgi:hypothetical protein